MVRHLTNVEGVKLVSCLTEGFLHLLPTDRHLIDHLQPYYVNFVRDVTCIYPPVAKKSSLQVGSQSVQWIECQMST